MGSIAKWGLIIVGVYLVYRFLMGSTQQSSLQSQWTPSVYPYRYGGGALYYSPGMVSGYFRPAPWNGGTGFSFARNGY